MDGGIIGQVPETIDKVESFLDTREVGDFELKRALDIRRVIEGPNGKQAYEGQAAIERVTTTDTFEFSQDRIVSTEMDSKTPFFTSFVIIPDSFVAVENSTGAFVFDLVHEQTGVRPERISINLNDYYSERKEAEPWKVGFYGRPGNARSGVVYGNGVMNDNELGEILEKTTLNQLGLEEIQYHDFSMKITVSESGYVKVFQPSNFESEDFIQYVADHIVPHIE